MNHFRLKYFASLAGASICLMAAGFASAQSVDQAMEMDDQRIQSAVQSQQNVDAIATETDRIIADFKTVLKQIESQRVYNAGLELQIADQEMQLADLAQSLDEAQSIEVNLVPLQLQMVDALGQFIELDLPFLLDERRDAVERLRSNVSRSDLSLAEKYRQILETYGIESQYSSRIVTYTDTIAVNGVDLEVDILRIGRIALMYQTKDQAITGAWNSDTGAWEQLDSGTYKSAIAAALRIAHQFAAYDIMSLPIQAPKG